MSLVLNTNLNSLNAQNNLAESGMKLSTALQQLSSGLRITRAADDSAGLAISERFRADTTTRTHERRIRTRGAYAH